MKYRFRGQDCSEYNDEPKFRDTRSLYGNDYGLEKTNNVQHSNFLAPCRVSFVVDKRVQLLWTVSKTIGSRPKNLDLWADKPLLSFTGLRQ